MCNDFAIEDGYKRFATKMLKRSVFSVDLLAIVFGQVHMAYFSAMLLKPNGLKCRILFYVKIRIIERESSKTMKHFSETFFNIYNTLKEEQRISIFFRLLCFKLN